MNSKLELIIESILNEDEQQAKALFHEFVVAKSREIYESLMDEDLGGNAAQSFVQDLTQQDEQAQEMGLGEDDLAGGEIELGGDEDGFGDEETFGDEDGEEFGDEEGEHEEIVTKLDDLEAQLAELKAMMGEEGAEGEEEFGDEGEEEFGGESDFDMDDGVSGSGKSGSGKSGSASGFGTSGSGSAEDLEEAFGLSGSGKSGSGKSGSGKSGSGMSGSGSGYKKSEVEIMKEYVDKIGEIYKVNSPNSETGKTVGTGGDEPTINAKSEVGPGADFGGTEKNLVRGGAEQSPDGKQFKEPTNEYAKGRTEFPHAGQFKNVPGNKKVWDQKGPSDGHGAEKRSGAEGKTVGTGKSDKPGINAKGVEGGKGQPTGKK